MKLLQLWGCHGPSKSLGVAEGYISAEVGQDNRRTRSVSLAPHEFVHIGRNHVCVNPLHSLELRLHTVPVGLDVLGVNTSRGVDEVQRVVDGAVSLLSFSGGYKEEEEEVGSLGMGPAAGPDRVVGTRCEWWELTEAVALMVVYYS